jgi:hypothetical protein
MRFRTTCLWLCLPIWSASVENGGCSAPTAAVASSAQTDGSAAFPADEAGSSDVVGAYALDGSACAPGDVSSFVPVYKPSPRYADACTPDQLAAVIRDCFDPATDSQSACDVWGRASGNQACLNCWSGPVTTSTWAPYLYVDSEGETTYVNVSGCVVLADPSQLPCAETIQNDFACDLDACEENCPIPTDGSASYAVAALENCFDSADMGGGCSVYSAGAAGAQACRATLAASGPAAFCFDAEKGGPQALLQYFTLACGAAPPVDGGEAGPDAGAVSPSEAGDSNVAGADASADGTDASADGGSDAP